MTPLNLVKNLLTPAPETKPEDELEQLRRRVAELEQRQPRVRRKNAQDAKKKRGPRMNTDEHG
jgi:hypothetical protein